MMHKVLPLILLTTMTLIGKELSSIREAKTLACVAWHIETTVKGQVISKKITNIKSKENVMVFKIHNEGLSLSNKGSFYMYEPVPGKEAVSSYTDPKTNETILLLKREEEGNVHYRSLSISKSYKIKSLCYLYK